jgi:hypothetical protein
MVAGRDVSHDENKKVFLVNFLLLLIVKCWCEYSQVIYHVETNLPNHSTQTWNCLYIAEMACLVCLAVCS